MRGFFQHRACAAGIAAATLLGASGCNLVSGLADLKIDEGSSSGGTGGGGNGGATTTGGGGTGGTGGGGGPTCDDGQTNGAETDRDCGGGECAPCEVGHLCIQGSDCETEICSDAGAGKVCVKATRVTVGNAHACAVLDTGALYCWGANDSGQLGADGVTESLSPVQVPLDKIADATAGGVPGDATVAHTCAITQSGQVYCWGANGSGQLGKGDMANATTPTQVTAPGQVAGVAAGGAFTCAVLVDGGVYCWGKNESGEIGNGGQGAEWPAPEQVVDAGSAKGVAAGARHACALLADDSLQCWGDNMHGQVASDPPSGAAKVNAVAGLSAVVGVAAGQDFTCARVATALSCWGDNSDAQLTGDVAEEQITAPASLGLTGVLDVALGADGVMDMPEPIPRGGHACALLDTGKVACWGNDRSGQLGRGMLSGGGEGATPAEIEGLDGVIDIAAGAEVSCAVLTSGGVRCWGRNDRGQLGTGAKGDSQSSPVPVAWP